MGLLAFGREEGKKRSQLLILLAFPVLHCLYFRCVSSAGHRPPATSSPTVAESFLWWTYVSRGRVQRRPPIS